MPAHCSYLLVLTLCLLPGILTGQGTALPPPLAWWPPLPLQGSLVLMAVRPLEGDSVAAVRGELAGEALHFERFADGFRALGAVPLGASDSVAARVVVERTDSTGDTVFASLPVRVRRVPRERLRVAPEFAQPPESLAERIRLEQELVQEARQRSHDTPRLWHAPFVRPSSGAVTSAFGVARVFNQVLRSRHWGVDFAGQTGAPVRAANRGVVVLVADLYYSGTTVLVDHGAGLITGYFHLSRVLVVPSDTVDVGHVIGRVGSSGRVTRPHLHWFGAYGSVTVDPLDLVRPNGPTGLTPGPPP
jgi:murein DD-endopeptidase MepM/ murein hydrolase activator NlpD